ncbi:MAG: MFS transporter [Rhizomicrobium sp.]
MVSRDVVDIEVENLSNARKAWTLALLFLAYVLSFVDRTILSLMVQPMRTDLGLSDVQIGLLQGTAFAIFYTLMGLPIATLSDRISRRVIVAAGIFVWSLMTAGCGLAARFWQLFLFRMGVGVGEASLSPATYSLLADLYPKERLGRVLGIYSSGIHVGAGLAFVVGGMVVAMTQNLSGWVTPFGFVRSWQIAFLIIGAPGILLALLSLTMVEPRERESQTKPPAALAAPFLSRHAGFFACHFSGFSLIGLVAAALMAWLPAFFIRKFGVTIGVAGFDIGIAVGVFGTFGAVAGGFLIDRLTKTGIAASPLYVGAAGLLVAGVLGLGLIFAHTLFACLGLICLLILATSVGYPAGAAALQMVTPPGLRARVSAVYLIVVSLVAVAGGPALIPLVARALPHGSSNLGLAIGVTTFGASVLGTAALILSSRLMWASNQRGN